MFRRVLRVTKHFEVECLGISTFFSTRKQNRHKTNFVVFIISFQECTFRLQDAIKRETSDTKSLQTLLQSEVEQTKEELSRLKDEQIALQQQVAAATHYRNSKELVREKLEVQFSHNQTEIDQPGRYQ